ncbi:MAG: hypothetical protein ACRD0P_14940 [Stackebrandtia sp.]
MNSRRRLPHGLIAIVLLAVLAVVGQLFVLFMVGAIGFPASDDTTRISVSDAEVAFVVEIDDPVNPRLPDARGAQ